MVHCPVSVIDNLHCHIYEVAGATPVKEAEGTAYLTNSTNLMVSTATSAGSNGLAFVYIGGNHVMATFVVDAPYGAVENTPSSSNDTAMSAIWLDVPGGIESAAATASQADNYVAALVVLAPP
jgi:hypothetical protein